MVDRTLNEWSEWQLKNLNAIVWLYRGEVEKYQQLLAEYCGTLHGYASIAQDQEIIDAMHGGTDFAATVADLKAFLAQHRAQAKQSVEAASRKEKKQTQAFWDQKLAWIEEIIGVAEEANWLYEKFGEGEYQDIPGLCKMASRAEIAEKNFSLTPGAYVGVATVEDDGVNFAQRMGEIHRELLKLQAESNELMQIISKNMKEMGL